MERRIMRKIIYVGLLILALNRGLVQASSQLNPVTPPDKILGIVLAKADQDFPKVQDLLAIIHVESLYNSKAKNGKAHGLMQVERGSFNPEKNVSQGVTLLQGLYERLGSRNKAIVAYNIGEGNLSNKRLSLRGKNYLRKIEFLSEAYAEAYSLNEEKGE
jgi:soluble lytic murein transglycosylase-like protein